jgi:hypothetical protein
MKRYLVFAGQEYYPSGGWDDFHDSFDDLEQARKAANEWVSDSGFYWWQIVDLTVGTIVAEG